VEILHRNSHGIVIARYDYKTRSKVRVYSEDPCTGKTFGLRTYRFNLIADQFISPYIGWSNLDCCGGWSCDEEYLDTAVQTGKKLFAGRLTMLRNAYCPNWPTREQAAAEFAQLCSTFSNDVYGAEEKILPSDGYYRTFICRTGKLSDYYDLDAVFGHYEKLGLPFHQETVKQIQSFCDANIRSFGEANPPFIYTNAGSIAELITTGLLLGYPLESTASIIME